jgi:hypothetical protein
MNSSSGMSVATVTGTTMKQQLTALRAETLAIQAVLTNLLFQLKRLDPVLADAIARSFDAADQIERAGRLASSEPVVKALVIIEELRGASLGRDRPRQTS